MSFMGVSIGVSVLGTAGKFIQGAHQKHLANQINPEFVPYEISPYAQAELGNAQTMLNGRMPGAANEEQNIANSQSNYISSVGRNATDGAQALALGSLATGITNNAYSALGSKEAQYKNSLIDNLNAAYNNMSNEYYKKYQSQMGKYESDVQAKSALMNAGAQNESSALNDFSSQAFMMSMYNPQFFQGKTKTPSFNMPENPTNSSL